MIQWDNKPLDNRGKNDLIAYEKGGVYTSIVRKDLLFSNNIWFPENTRFEDNYWGSLLMPYINKVAFVYQVGYYYRQHEASTTHEREGEQYRERIKVENDLLHEIKNRDLFEPYKDAWEYVYAYRYGVNTISLLLNRFNKPSIKDIRTVQEDLDGEFPDWKNNLYWKQRTDIAGRLVSYIKLYFPNLFLRIRKLLHLFSNKR